MSGKVDRQTTVNHTDFGFFPHFVGYEGAVGVNDIVVLHIFRLFKGLSVDINYLIFYFEIVAGKTDATFHIVFSAVHRTIHHLTEIIGIILHYLGSFIDISMRHLGIAKVVAVGVHHLPSFLKTDGVIIRILAIVGDGVAGRKVKHHYVVALHTAIAFQAAIGVLRMLKITLGFDYWQGVLTQGEMYRSDRHARTVSHLVYPEIIAHKQCFFE